MPNYEFHLDLPIAKETERAIGEKLRKKGSVILEYNNDYRFDLRCMYNGAQFLVEVKEDFTCAQTGNVGLEFHCRGEYSGIYTTEADYYVYRIHHPDGSLVDLFINTTRLIRAVRFGEYDRIACGGDVGSNSYNYLFKLEKFLTYGKRL